MGLRSFCIASVNIPFADLNNVQVADQLEAWLKGKKLDGKDVPHQGPQKKFMELTIPLEK